LWILGPCLWRVNQGWEFGVAMGHSYGAIAKGLKEGWGKRACELYWHPQKAGLRLSSNARCQSSADDEGGLYFSARRAGSFFSQTVH